MSLFFLGTIDSLTNFQFSFKECGQDCKYKILALSFAKYEQNMIKTSLVKTSQLHASKFESQKH